MNITMTRTITLIPPSKTMTRDGWVACGPDQGLIAGVAVSVRSNMHMT